MLLTTLLINSSILYAYTGPLQNTEKQPGLEDIIEQWQPGDQVPEYMLLSDSMFHPWTQYRAQYIEQSKNVDFLFHLILYPNMPKDNADNAMLRLIELEGLQGFGNRIKKVGHPASFLFDIAQLNKLRQITLKPCVKVEWLFINNEDMAEEKARKIFEDIQAELSKHRQLRDVYSEFLGRKLPIANGGHFIFSHALNDAFLKYVSLPPSWDNDDRQNIAKLRLGESWIASSIAFHSNDPSKPGMLVLYTIIDKYLPE